MEKSFFPNVGHTISAIELVKQHLQKLCRMIDVIVNVIFILLYVYSIYSNLDHPILLRINIALFSISLVFFVLHAIGFHSKSKAYATVVNRHIGRAVRYLKMMIKLFTLGLSAYELMHVSYSDLSLIFLIVTSVAFLGQIAFEILRRLAEMYFDILKSGIEMDIREIKESEATKTILKAADVIQNPKASIAEAITRSLKSKAEGSTAEPSMALRPAHPVAAQKTGKWKKKIAARSAERKIDKAVEKAEKNAAKKERSRRAVQELGQTLKNLFQKPKQ